MEESTLRTRIAPTPSGLLHPGNGASFVATWCLARATGGRVLLRIDDLDEDRRRDAFLEDIFFTMEWLGLDWDEGPSGVDDFRRNYSQHLRLDLYHEALGRLRREGQLYACICSRREIRERSPDGLYPGTCRNAGLPLDTPDTAWRIRVPEPTVSSFHEWRQSALRRLELSAAMGDFVVRQKNGLPAYQIASLADDLFYRINFIVRGEDLLASTAAQVFLAERLGEAAFGRVNFWHHPLLTSPDGEKLSKSRGAGSLSAWRLSGKRPVEIYREAARWLGLDERSAESLEEMVQTLAR